MKNTSKSLSTKLAEGAWIRSHGVLGGVCGAIRNATGYDLNLIRILAVVLALFFFPGAMLSYGLAWLLLPDASGASHMDNLTSPGAGLFGAGFFILFGVLSITSWDNSAAGSWALLSIVVLGVICLLLAKTSGKKSGRKNSAPASRPADFSPSSDAGARPEPTAPPKPLPPRQVKPALSGKLQLAGAGLGLLGAALYILVSSPATAATLLTAFGIALAIFALTALVANARGHKSGLPGILATLALIFGSPLLLIVWAVPNEIATTPVSKAGEILGQRAFQLRAESLSDLNSPVEGGIVSHSYASDATVLIPPNWKGTIEITMDQGRTLTTVMAQTWQTNLPKNATSFTFNNNLPLPTGTLEAADLQLGDGPYRLESRNVDQTNTCILPRGSDEEKAKHRYRLHVKGGRLTLIEGKIK
ncbi:hypothetical protein HMPREF2851_06055 [Actinomyces sp. HMSC064C12]|nr:hypothetical protein HMPREF2851_06055 [Actinomyces sp. HMSC064C12]